MSKAPKLRFKEFSGDWIASIDKEIAKIDDELAVYLRELGL